MVQHMYVSMLENLPSIVINHDIIYMTQILIIVGQEKKSRNVNFQVKTAGLLVFGSGPTPAAAGHESED